MATKPSKKTAANAKDGAKSAPASKATSNKKQEAGGKSPPDHKKSAPAASKGTPASKPSKKPAKPPEKPTKPAAGTPVPSSVKKPATPKAEKSTAAASKVKEAKAPEKKTTVKAADQIEVTTTAPIAKAKAKAEAPKDEPATPAKAAKPKSESKSKSAPLTPPVQHSKPVPPPKIKKPILDSAPEVIIKQAYNPAKLPPFIKKQQQRLIELRSALLDSMDLVAKDSLRNRPEGSEASVGGMHMADAGSDAYDRDFALSMLSKEQDALYEINEALDRVGQGVYGVCELSGEKINDERLEALPYTRYTREMQELIERDQMGGRLRRAPVRSVFGLEEDGEEGEDGEDEDRPANNNQNESSLDFMKE